MLHLSTIAIALSPWTDVTCTISHWTYTGRWLSRVFFGIEANDPRVAAGGFDNAQQAANERRFPGTVSTQ